MPVLKDDPCNLSDAIQAMKQAIAADNIVTGKARKDSAKQKSTDYSVKQSVVEEETQEEVCDDELSAKQVRFQKKSFREQPSSPAKNSSGSPARLSRPFYCYGCGDFGHYKFSCPYVSPGGTTRLPPRQPQPLNSQGQGSKTTNS